jgi:hypothetical protein
MKALKSILGSMGLRLKYALPSAQMALSAVLLFWSHHGRSIVGSEFPAPLADGFVRNNDSAFGQKIFNITEAQTEAMINPHGVADDFQRETVSVVTGWGALHAMSLSVGCPS